MSRLIVILVVSLLGCVVAIPRQRARAGGGGTFVYVHDNAAFDNRVFGSRLEPDGALTPIPGSPFSTGDDGSKCGRLCQTAAFSGRRDLLFASGRNGITVFRVDDADGALSVVPGSPFGGARTLGVAVVEGLSRTFVYGSDFDNDRISGFQVRANDTLAPTPGFPFPSGSGPVGLSAAKGFLFAALFNDGAIAAFKVRNDGTPVQGPGSPFAVAPETYNVEVDPTGKFVYANDAEDSDLFAFKVKSDASLIPVDGSPFTDALRDSESLAVSKKPLLCSLDTDGGRVQAFRRNKNGSVTALGRVQDSGLPGLEGVGAFDPSGKFLVLADDADDEARSFSVNKNTGVITPVDTESAELGSPNAVVFAQP